MTRTLPRASVSRAKRLITFDDGYADNHAHARPIMERLGVHGIFYISAGYIGSGREFWWDELERLLLLNNALPRTLLLEHHGVPGLNLDDADAGAMRPHCDALLLALRALHAKREELLSELRGLVHSTNARATALPMSESELKAFAASPAVTIGAHTLLHCCSLRRPTSRGAAPRDHRVEETAQRDARHGVERFAYPFGTLDDFNEESIRVCKEAGFRHAAANRPGLVHKASPSFAFPRVLVRDWTAEEMADHLRPYQL
ncbi:MAG: polysaccharide deacetylase family protein [Flavobacteriales bacterium]|nr:polysaccharide deacetylase family protein [Flavobacteriales bacterium]